ncbi:MAG: preprotein translocase subunit SecE [Clostridia bacterium]|nr:preprotein translocase subunit SecE [Clostridia bacterium]
MKTVNKICQILAIVFGLASLVLFFTEFATVVSNGESISFIGAQLGFGGGKYGLAKSADILFCFWLTVIGTALSGFSFKSKKLRYAAPVFSLASGIYMLVIALSKPEKFVDKRPLEGVSSITYSNFVLLTAIALFVFTAFAIAYLFIDDMIEVSESKGAKKTIIKRLISFLRDYKSEVKKIVWPGLKDIVKNTGIVLLMCLLVGILIWAADFGLGKLLDLILGLKS